MFPSSTKIFCTFIGEMYIYKNILVVVLMTRVLHVRTRVNGEKVSTILFILIETKLIIENYTDNKFWQLTLFALIAEIPNQIPPSHYRQSFS